MTETTAAVSASLVILITGCHLALYGAPEVTADDGRTFTPTRAVYYSTLNDWTSEISWSCRLIEAIGSGPDITYEDPADVPLWVPAPPDGWDMGVRIEAGRGEL